MSGVITLTTDFGHKGPFAAVMRGVILARAPEARIIDLTHEIHVHWPAEAGFWLARAYPYFAPGTVHIAVVDPGVGTSRAILAAEHDGHVFLAPDNGLLAQMIEDDPAAKVYRLDESWRRQQDWPAPSHTFHGRDIFAPLAADLASGRTAPADIGPVTTDIVPSLLEPPAVTGDIVKGCVVTIDNFGNLITNIDASLLASFTSARVQAAGRSLPLLDTYGQTKPGEFLALINSFGVLELACAEGNAADRLGLGRGAPVVVNGQTKAG
jgi:S-adenosylmethionine hydrolase